MMAYTKYDQVRMFLTGGAGNSNPSLSLGGAISAREVKGLGAIVTTPVPGLHILQAFPENGEGNASLYVDTAGTVSYTAPGESTAGTAVTMAEGDTVIVTADSSTSKALRIKREADLIFLGTMEFSLIEIMNGVLSMNNVLDAERTAGGMRYRGIIVKNAGSQAIYDLSLSVSASPSLQSSFSFGYEVVVSDAIQEIEDEETAPEGISFSASFYVPLVDAGQSVGVWIRRTFPALGEAKSKESADFVLSYQGV